MPRAGGRGRAAGAHAVQTQALTLNPAVQYNAGVVADLLHRALADVDEPLVISALAPAPDPPPHDLCSTEALGEARALRQTTVHGV